MLISFSNFLICLLFLNINPSNVPKKEASESVNFTLSTEIVQENREIIPEAALSQVYGNQLTKKNYKDYIIQRAEQKVKQKKV